MYHFFTIRLTFKFGGTCGDLNILIYNCEMYGLTTITINRNNVLVKTATLYLLSPLLNLYPPPPCFSCTRWSGKCCKSASKGPRGLYMPRAPRNLDPALDTEATDYRQNNLRTGQKAGCFTGGVHCQSDTPWDAAPINIIYVTLTRKLYK